MGRPGLGIEAGRMRYTATFDIPDDPDAWYRLYWGANQITESYKHVRYPVDITFLDPSGGTLEEYHKK
jgi:hypothetical protein